MEPMGMFLSCEQDRSKPGAFVKKYTLTHLEDSSCSLSFQVYFLKP